MRWVRHSKLQSAAMCCSFIELPHFAADWSLECLTPSVAASAHSGDDPTL